MSIRNLPSTFISVQTNLKKMDITTCLRHQSSETSKFVKKQAVNLLFVSALFLVSNITYSQVVPYPVFSNTGNQEQDSANYKAALNNYESWKLSQVTSADRSSNNTRSNIPAKTLATNAANCIIPRDATWTAVPTNDDGSLGPVTLGFTFNLYGTSYSQVYINTNGNLTFTQAYSEYVPTGFPFSLPMVAAFWADEDTRPQCGGVGTGIIYYKREATRLLVTWENVGYYNQHCDKTVTFQIVIGTLNDPVIGAGNNVLFNYGDMNWTTGDASGGSGGFGGAAATVGINQGGGVNFVQVGRFDHPGTDYDGGGGVNDGVDYLDNRCFPFNVSIGGNIPPSFSGLPAANTISLAVGTTANYAIQAIGPEVGQTVNTTLEANSLCGVTATITNGLVSTTNLSVTGMACNVGTHTVTLTALDNGTPVGTTMVNLTIIVTDNPCANCYYSKSTGDLHNVLTWGVNPDGSGANPPDFGAGKTFNLANRVVNYTLTGNWTVGGILNIPAGSQLQISSFSLSIADITGTGLFNGTNSSNLTVTKPSSGGTSLNFIPAANNLNNLTITSTAATTLASALNVYGVLDVESGTLNTTNALTLKSTAVNTARVSPVVGSITGTVTVERYIPARRAWRIMSAPVDGSQTINSAWQEGVTTSSPNPNPNPGYGTHITEGSPASGLDQNPRMAMSSIKTYMSSSDSWVPLLNTSTTHVNSDAYMLFVRGDRGIPLGGNDVPATPTTLRATGPLKVGDQLFPVSATGFTAIPNPFASPINFATLTKANVQNNFYVWDPKIGGTDGVGGYVLLSFNGVGYDVVPAAVSPESQYIQSGQGFMVHSTGAAGNITIKESDKSATPAMDVFRVASGTSPVNATPGFRINLQSVNADNTTSVLDEVLASYGANYSDKVDDLDAQKISNINENLAIVRAGKTLMVDRSAALDKNDTISLKLWNTAAKRYLLEFNPANISSSVSTAYLMDNYLKTFTPVALNKVSQLYFTTSTDPASVNENRFMIVFNSPAETISMLNNRSGIITYPNPVEGKTIQLMLNDQPQGTYKVELVNGMGQVVYKTQMVHAGGSAIQKLQLVNKPATGVYMLNISNSTTVRNTLKIVIK